MISALVFGLSVSLAAPVSEPVEDKAESKRITECFRACNAGKGTDSQKKQCMRACFPKGAKFDK